MGSGIVVGIDPSLTSTGVAQLHNGKPYALNALGRKLHVQASYKARAERMVYTLGRVLQNVPDDTELVVVEGMAYAATGNHTDPDVFGLWWHVVTHLNARGVPIAVIPPLTLKVWATGRAAEKINGRMVRVEKPEMIEAARAQFPEHARAITNGDVADALHAAACGASWLGHQLPTPMRRHKFNVDAVAWPETST